MDWESKITVKKGNIGESIVKGLLERKGYIVYTPDTEGAHAFDFIAIKDKKTALIFEVKSKSKRIYYDDASIDYENFKKYLEFSKTYKMQCFVFFVDSSLGEVYGNYLNELLKPFTDVKGKKYPSIENNNRSIYFPMSNMLRRIYTLNKTETEQLNFYTSTSKQYEYKTNYNARCTKATL